MVDDSNRLNFPILAGSSLPVTWRLPDLELDFGCQLESALMVGVGGSDPMDYHALEAMQCMIERRQGGESGVSSVQLIDGDSVWQAGRDGSLRPLPKRPKQLRHPGHRALEAGAPADPPTRDDVVLRGACLRLRAKAGRFRP